MDMDQLENNNSEKPDNIKQVIIWRNDLKVRKGKLAAQISHASLKVFLDRIEVINGLVTGNSEELLKSNLTPDMISWINWKLGEPGFTKIVVYCNSENELYNLEKLANEANLPNALIIDNGCTEFHGVKTPTCLCIGPAKSSLIDPITKNLPLL